LSRALHHGQIVALERPRLRLWPFAEAVALASACSIGSAAADPPPPETGPTSVYQWVDERGGFHYTPNPALIPPGRPWSELRATPVSAQNPTEERGQDVAVQPVVGPTAAGEAVAAHRTPTPPPVAAATPARVPALAPGFASAPIAAPALLPAPAATRDPTVTSIDPPAAGPTPEASAAAAAPEGWAVQIAAAPAGREPDWPMELPLASGERLYRSTAVVGDSTWSRLRIGTFATREAAESARARLAGQFPGAWVTPVGPSQAPASPVRTAEAGAPPLATPEPLLPDVAARPAATAAARYAIQLRAIPASATRPETPALAAPPGTRIYWVTLQGDDRSWQRLRLGDFPTLAAARAALLSVRSEFPDAWIATVEEGRQEPR
jgi:hypothetical protein